MKEKPLPQGRGFLISLLEIVKMNPLYGFAPDAFSFTPVCTNCRQK